MREAALVARTARTARKGGHRSVRHTVRAEAVYAAAYAAQTIPSLTRMRRSASAWHPWSLIGSRTRPVTAGYDNRPGYVITSSTARPSVKKGSPTKLWSDSGGTSWKVLAVATAPAAVSAERPELAYGEEVAPDGGVESKQDQRQREDETQCETRQARQPRQPRQPRDQP